MAAPVKAFIDATGLSRMMVRPMEQPGLSINAGGMLRALGRSVWTASSNKLIASVTHFPLGQAMISVNAKIPPPPLGKMMVCTFPPVYKERVTATVPRPSEGQVWPRLSNKK